MTFSELLERSVARAGNPVCFGMDPVLSRMPAASTPEETIRSFYLSIFDEMDRREVYPAAVKPNSAYYEQVSVEALLVLRELVGAARDRGIPVILDAKRGDIGKSSAAYARAAFGTMGADATTVSPYMGGDSVGPFLKVAPERGVYALLRTSNPGAADLQDQRREDGAPFWQAVAEKLVEWDNGSLGAVVGATNLAEMEKIAGFFASKGHEIPFLIPGVGVPGVAGQQGGEAAAVVRAMRAGGAKRAFHLLNSSSGLSFAYEVRPGTAPEIAAVDALEALAESAKI